MSDDESTVFTPHAKRVYLQAVFSFSAILRPQSPTKATATARVGKLVPILRRVGSQDEKSKLALR